LILGADDAGQVGEVGGRRAAVGSVAVDSRTTADRVRERAAAGRLGSDLPEVVGPAVGLHYRHVTVGTAGRARLTGDADSHALQLVARGERVERVDRVARLRVVGRVVVVLGRVGGARDERADLVPTEDLLDVGVGVRVHRGVADGLVPGRAGRERAPVAAGPVAGAEAVVALRAAGRAGAGIGVARAGARVAGAGIGVAGAGIRIARAGIRVARAGLLGSRLLRGLLGSGLLRGLLGSRLLRGLLGSGLAGSRCARSGRARVRTGAVAGVARARTGRPLLGGLLKLAQLGDLTGAALALLAQGAQLGGRRREADGELAVDAGAALGRLGLLGDVVTLGRRGGGRPGVSRDGGRRRGGERDCEDAQREGRNERDSDGHAGQGPPKG
jgi:hypothetical protein